MGSKRYKVFRAIFNATDESIEETIAFNTTVVTDDKEDWINEDDDNDKSDDESQSGTQHNVPTDNETASLPVNFFPHRPE